ncbi:hypothetical protein K443DRAFT_11483 [Laccaria amethystina LaAM-08-1]|uniref:Uncharacterized protein n=1 Tax=Laccaria amethystina LaAM-08-1 TaxID=1095629 RepID=A0A0C9WTJ2_9AGAR|nr:hypothetical protein K443DRAFT_11483 [Laccaria amethystina LaAM-08-1]
MSLDVGLTSSSYISPFVFTRTLLPILEETAKEADSHVRVVNVTSIVHTFLVPKVTEFKAITDLNVKCGGIFLSTLRSLEASREPLDQVLSKAYMAFPEVLGALVGLAIAAPSEGALMSVFAAASKAVRDNRERRCGVSGEQAD